MIRGTTPTLEFVLPFDVSELATAWVTIAQEGDVVVDKPLSDCQCEGNKLSLRLTQEDTLKLQGNTIAEIQIRALTVGGDAIASDIIRDLPSRILKDGVI